MDAIKKTYFDIKNPGSYGGVQRLKRNLDKSVKYDKIKEFLDSEDTYVLHKPIRKRFPMRRMIAQGVDHIWQMDLSDMQRYMNYNDGYRFLLFIIDVYSRYLWLIPLKNKSAATVAAGVITVIKKDGRIPGNITTDHGTEFSGLKFQHFVKEYNILHHYGNSVNKAAIAERVQRTIKERMHRYFTHTNTYKYIDILKDLTTSYNKSFHRSIKMTPSQALLQKPKLSKRTNMLKSKPKFNVGDHVRVSRSGDKFKKGFEQGWTEEVFTIYKVTLKEKIPMYYLKDLQESVVEGGFYKEELQLVIENPEKRVYKIEKIISERGKGKNKQYLVKWLGYPESFNSYIKASAIKKLH